MIQIRPGTDADRPQILGRMEEVFGSGPARRAERLWDWQWHQDPRLPSPGYRGVVAEWRGQIIGNLATIPAGLHIGGEPAQAWWFVDVLVHWGLTRRALREHRRAAASASPDLSRGIAAALFEHPAAGPIQLGKHISDPMTTIAERVGFVPQPQTGTLHRRVSTKHSLGRVLGRPLGDLLGTVSDLSLGPLPRPRLPIRIHEGPFDTRFDSLWGSVKAAYPAICRRDARLLDWRYRRHPDGDYHVLTLDSPASLRGYCIIKTFERAGRCRGKIVDLLAAPGDGEAREALLAAALRELRSRRVERVECFYTGSALEQTLFKLGFRPRLSKTLRAQPLIGPTAPRSGAGPLCDPRGWGRGLTRPERQARDPVMNPIRHLRQRLARQIRKRLDQREEKDHWPQWFLLAGLRGPESRCHPAPAGLTPIYPPADRFWADPFTWSRDGDHYVFCEEYPFDTRRGRISVLALGADLKPKGPAVPVIDEPRHLSYPFLIEYQDALYMVPESARSGRVDLYRCTDFPHRWVWERSLLTGIEAADATLFEHQGRWWLFCAARLGQGADQRVALRLPRGLAAERRLDPPPPQPPDPGLQRRPARWPRLPRPQWRADPPRPGLRPPLRLRPGAEPHRDPDPRALRRAAHLAHQRGGGRGLARPAPSGLAPGPPGHGRPAPDPQGQDSRLSDRLPPPRCRPQGHPVPAPNGAQWHGMKPAGERRNGRGPTLLGNHQAWRHDPRAVGVTL